MGEGGREEGEGEGGREEGGGGREREEGGGGRGGEKGGGGRGGEKEDVREKKEGGGFIISYIPPHRCMKVWCTWTLTRLSWLPSSMVSGGIL